MSKTTIKQKVKYTKSILLMVDPFYGSLFLQVPLKFPESGPDYFTNGKTLMIRKNYAEEIHPKTFATVVKVLLGQYAHLHTKRAYNKGAQKIRFGIASIIRMFIDVSNDTKTNDNTSSGDKSMYFNIDDFIKKDPLFERFKNYENLSTEEIYEKLPPLPEIEITQNPDGSLDIHSPDRELTDEEIKEIIQGLSVSYKNDVDSDEDKSSIMQNIMTSYMNAKMQGKVPSGIERLIGEYTKGKLDWRKELQNIISENQDDYDFINRETRYMSIDSLSNFVFPTMNGETVNVIFIYDTSGSMSQKEITHALSETYSIIETFKKAQMFVMSCDAEVYEPKKIENSYDLEDYKIQGGGGTSFVPPFNYIEENDIDADIIIYFTDGYGDFPDNEPNDKKVLWLMTTDVEAPFGKTVKYNID